MRGISMFGWWGIDYDLAVSKTGLSSSYSFPTTGFISTRRGIVSIKAGVHSPDMPGDKKQRNEMWRSCEPLSPLPLSFELTSSPLCIPAVYNWLSSLGSNIDAKCDLQLERGGAKNSRQMRWSTPAASRWGQRLLKYFIIFITSEPRWFT